MEIITLIYTKIAIYDMGGNRRKNGERREGGETKWDIIKYALNNGGSFSEPDLRDHLREEFNISEPKGIKNHLKDLEKMGILKNNPSKGLPNLWSLNTDLSSIKKMIDLGRDKSGEKEHISELQQHDFIIESIAEEYKKYIRAEIDYCLCLSPTFFKTFLENKPKTVITILKKYYSVSMERRRVQEIFISKCIFKEEENSTCLLKDGVDLRCYKDMGLDCVDEKAITDVFEEMIGVLPYFKSCLMVDSIENPEEEQFLKILDKVDEVLYLVFYTLMYDIYTFSVLQDMYTKVRNSFKEETRNKFDKRVKAIQKETIGESWIRFFDSVNGKGKMAFKEINEKIEKGTKRMKEIIQEIMAVS